MLRDTRAHARMCACARPRLSHIATGPVAAARPGPPAEPCRIQLRPALSILALAFCAASGGFCASLALCVSSRGPSSASAPARTPPCPAGRASAAKARDWALDGAAIGVWRVELCFVCLFVVAGIATPCPTRHHPSLSYVPAFVRPAQLTATRRRSLCGMRASRCFCFAWAGAQEVSKLKRPVARRRAPPRDLFIFHS
ncbi:uncharacterized protein V1518DRAFT_293067 [Limtongia smithiae]|uniref:uncharacterized protein n=1 Tax=Limtongia smithiae TaxID=1125753 RepID=UPI0034CD44AA